MQKAATYSKSSVNTTSNSQCVLESVIEFHDGCLVTTTVAVIGSTKNGHYVAIMAPIVPLWSCAQEQQWVCGEREKRRFVNMNTTLTLKDNLGSILCELTSMTSWWALLTRVKPLLWLKFSDISYQVGERGSERGRKGGRERKYLSWTRIVPNNEHQFVH